jgi:hypothetical protein
MFFSCECCVLSGRGLCVGLITRPEESYRVWCVSECDRETSILRRPCAAGDCHALKKCLYVFHLVCIVNTDCFNSGERGRSITAICVEN